MKLGDTLKLIETAIADAALIERAIATIVHGLTERAQPQALIQADVATVHQAHGELIDSLKSAHVEVARAAGVTSQFEPPADPEAVAAAPAAVPKKKKAPKKKARR